MIDRTFGAEGILIATFAASRKFREGMVTMRRSIICVLLLALSIIGWAVLLTQSTVAHADTASPYQGQSQFTVTGTVDQVDTDRDQITMKAPNSQLYTIDTSQSKVLLSHGAGATGDGAGCWMSTLVRSCGACTSTACIHCNAGGLAMNSKGSLALRLVAKSAI